MTITNKTSVSLKIMGSSVGPNETREFPENAFNTLSVHSDIGSCVITTEYSQRTIENFGKLVAILCKM